MNELITLEEIKKSIPNKNKIVTQEAVDIINSSLSEPEFQGESLLQTASTYESVLKGARASIPEYLNAIRFCAYMMSNESNYTEAYKKVFATRDFVKFRAHLPTDDPKYGELTSAASRYRRSKLVVDILTISQVPLDMIFAGHRYKAVGVLAEIMVSSKYDKDRVNAAKELLAATKSETTKLELEIGHSAGVVSMQEQLDKQLNELARNQQLLLASGHSIMDVQNTGISLEIIEGEVDD